MSALVTHGPTQNVERLPARMGFDTAAGFELLQRAAKAFASSDLVPKQYQGNLANCMIAMEMAGRIGASPMQVMQSLYIVHGQPSWSAKFLIACINSSGRFTSLRYEWRGEPGAQNFGCRAWAIEHRTGERLDGIWVDWKMVKAEGWDAKSGSKWKTMAEQMFIYRAAAFWQRAYAPEISMGMLTAEEQADVIDMPAPDRAPNLAAVEALNSQIAPAATATEQPALSAPAEQQTLADMPALSYAQVREQIDKAEDADALAIAADLIGEVQNEQQRAELAEVYAQRQKALSAK